MRFHSRWTLFWFLLLILAPALAFAWQGKVVGVSDGDTITVLHDGRGEKIRLYGVDCPERRQDFSQKAKQFTSEMVFGKTVDVKSMDTDRYGRTVGMVDVDGRSLNEELIKTGLAWVYTHYCRESFCFEWSEVQLDARKNKIGLWSIPNPTPPWDHRRGERTSQADSQGAPQARQKGK